LSSQESNLDNWVGGWDEPADSALSLPPSTTQNFGFLTPEMDIAKLYVVPSPSPSARISDNLGDDSFAFEDSITDEPLFQSPQTLLETIVIPTQPYLVSPASLPSPEPQDTRSPQKRKSSESDSPPPPRSGHSAPQKIAHNIIEKRYRENLNEKIGHRLHRLHLLWPSAASQAPPIIHSINHPGGSSAGRLCPAKLQYEVIEKTRGFVTN
jgi:hypothetical protein